MILVGLWLFARHRWLRSHSGYRKRGSCINKVGSRALGCLMSEVILARKHTSERTTTNEPKKGLEWRWSFEVY